MIDLAQKLTSFDFLSNQSKTEIWLCYMGAKPVSAFPNPHKEDLYNWLQKAGLKRREYVDNDLLVISKDEDKINKLLPILFSNTMSDIVAKCNLYGYPPKTALAVYRNFTSEKENLPIGTGVKKDNVFGITWWPYVRYIVRQDHELEDSQTAKKWSEIIKKDLPEIDKRFEKELSKIL